MIKNGGNVSGYPLGEIYEDDVFERAEMDLLDILDSGKKEDYDPLSFSQSGRIEVSIIIPVHDHFGYTYACLRSILVNTVKVDYEVIIADDHSTDLTTQIEDIVRGIRVIRNKEDLFFLKNCNNAAKSAKGRYILFLNNDTQVRYNWLYPLVDLMGKDESIGLVGSKLIFPDGRLQEAGGIVWCDGKAVGYGCGKDHRSPEFNYVKEVDHLSGASIMIRRDLWKEINGFDESFEPVYYGDIDLAFMVRKHGRKVVYQPASVVVCFGTISKGRNVQKGIKRSQSIDEGRFVDKWKCELLDQERSGDIFTARERKQKKKTILFISGNVPTYDKDAGSKTILNYMKLFLKTNYLVKLLPLDFYKMEPYTCQLQQMGIEVLYGDLIKSRLNEWIIKNQKDIEYAFINYPDPAYKIIDILRRTNIKIRYYGHDLHFLRLRRQYEIKHNSDSLQTSNIFLKKEGEIIKKSECVYYPSEVEVEIVKRQFGKENVKQISPYMYDDVDIEGYDPEKREGMMFIGGDHYPNEDAMLWFLTEIYPKVYRERKIPFYLVGANQSSQIKHLSIDGMINLGYLSEDELNDLYHKVRMAVIPLRFGAGIKGKVIDALYHGVPIVSTSVGIEGIPTAEAVVDASDTAEEFKDRIIGLYDDHQTLKAMSDKEKKLIKTYFSVETAWKKIKDDF